MKTIINILFFPALLYVLFGWIDGLKEFISQHLSSGQSVFLWFISAFIVVWKLMPPPSSKKVILKKHFDFSDSSLISPMGELSEKGLNELKENYNRNDYDPFKKSKESSIPDWVLAKSIELQKEKIADGSLYGTYTFYGPSGPYTNPNIGMFSCLTSEQSEKCIAVLIDLRRDPNRKNPFIFEYNDPPRRGWLIAVFNKNTAQAVNYRPV